MPTTARTAPDPLRRPARVAAVALAAALVAGCHANTIAESGYPMDYAQRHPIKVVEAAAVHEVLIGTGRGSLTPVQRAELTAYAGAWRRKGTGPMVIEVPAGSPNEYAAAQAAREVKAVLVAAGVPKVGVSTRSYMPDPTRELPPIRVVHATLKADVAGPCGVWPDDLGVQDWKHQIENRPYWNHGCATQKAFAAMIDNPADLVQPRSEQPPYAPRRQTVIEKYRQGQDTATVAAESDSSLSDVGK